jgi:hypothetical protein
MNRKIIFLTLLAFMAGCSQIENRSNTNKESPVKISGFRAGLIEFDSNSQPRIYQEGEEFTFEVNGKCVSATEPVDCQWRGFEFDFISPLEETRFDCVNVSSKPQDFVYPTHVVAENSKKVRWGFIVRGKAGHYIRPQYTAGTGDYPLEMNFSCSHWGTELLRWKVILTPPNKSANK